MTNTPTDPLAVAERLIELAEKATPGVAVRNDTPDYAEIIVGDHNIAMVATGQDADFIVAGFNDAPLLAAEVVRLTALDKEKTQKINDLLTLWVNEENKREAAEQRAESLKDEIERLKLSEAEAYRQRNLAIEEDITEIESLEAKLATLSQLAERMASAMEQRNKSYGNSDGINIACAMEEVSLEAYRATFPHPGAPKEDDHE